MKILLYCLLVTPGFLLAGIEQIGGNGTIDLPDDWRILERSPTLLAGSPDNGVFAFAQSDPVGAKWIPLVDQPDADRDQLFGHIWESQILLATSTVTAIGGWVGGVTQESFNITRENGFVLGFGNYTIQWTDLSFIYETRFVTHVAIDSGHVYAVTVGVESFADDQRRAEAVAVMNSLSTSNPFAIQNGSLGPLYLEIIENNLSLSLSVQASGDLQNWSEIGRVNATLPIVGGYRFFRFETE